MAFERIAENKIREAINDGRFDNLPNAGQRIDLEEYFETPAEVRMAYSILKSANCVPQEVELLKDIERLERTIATCADDVVRQAYQQRLRDCRLQLAVLLDRKRSRR
jgi:hypothetical protein